MRTPGFIYFDLDDTLLDHRHAEEQALGDLREELASLSAMPFDEVHQAYRRVNRRVWTEYAAGSRSKEETRSGRFELLFAALGVDEDPVQAADRYLEAYGDHWRWIDGARTVFERVAASFPVGVLTNGFAEAQRAKLARFPELGSLASTVVISEEEGVMKPHLRLFDIAARRAGHPSDAILYVGDSVSSDIEGGSAAGWQVAWFAPDTAVGPDVPRFSRWQDFSELLGLD